MFLIKNRLYKKGIINDEFSYVGLDSNIVHTYSYFEDKFQKLLRCYASAYKLNNCFFYIKNGNSCNAFASKIQGFNIISITNGYPVLMEDKFNDKLLSNIIYVAFINDKKALNKAYTMANIIPQSAPVNQKTWIKVERYGRTLAEKLGYINSISIAKYDNPNNKIGNDIVIPTTLYRIYYNPDAKFERCFKYENVLDVDYKSDKLKNHEIECRELKLNL